MEELPGASLEIPLAGAGTTQAVLAGIVPCPAGASLLSLPSSLLQLGLVQETKLELQRADQCEPGTKSQIVLAEVKLPQVAEVFAQGLRSLCSLWNELTEQQRNQAPAGSGCLTLPEQTVFCAIRWPKKGGQVWQ